MGVTLHYTASPEASGERAVRAIAAYQISDAAIPQTGTGTPFLGLAYTLVIDGAGAVYLAWDLDRRVWHSGAVVDGVSRNVTHVGMVYLGDREPNGLQLWGMARAIDWLERDLGRPLTIEGHKDSIPTSCPGLAWPTWKPVLVGLLQDLAET